MIEKKKYEAKKYTNRIENHFYINVKVDNNAFDLDSTSSSSFVFLL